MNPVPLDQISAATFSKCLNAAFTVQGGGFDGVELRLESVSAPTVSPPLPGGTQRIESFSLLFQSPSPRMLPQQIHALAHETLGRLDIFLVPTAKTANGFQYEAVFTRLI